MKKILSLSPLAYVVGIAVSSVSPATLAQEDIDQPERITVTGSNIKRIHNEDATPLQIIGADEIARSGKVTLTDVLRDLTVNTGNSQDEQATSSFSAGSASVGLRGLSPKNTLVLVNGQRVSNYGFALGTQDTFVDLNALPISAVQRVEVLKDGASAVYGSDAIAGVINIILKRDFEGVQVSASTGGATEGGLRQYTAGLVAGHGNINRDGYNVTVSLDVLERDGLNADERRLTRTGDYRHKPGGRLAGWNSGAGNYLDDPDNPRAFEQCPEGSEEIPRDAFTPGQSGTICGFNAQPFNTLQPEVSRKQFSAQATYVLNPAYELFAETLYSYNESSHTFSPPLHVGPGLRAYEQESGTLVDIPVVFPVGHPNNPTGAPLPFEYAFFDIGERLKSNTQIFNRVLGGVRYQGEQWDWELTALQSQSRQREYVDNFVDRYVFEQVLADGSYDFLGGNNDADIVDALRLETRRPGRYQTRALNLQASRILGHGQYGDYGFAAGVDWREESMDASTSPEVLTGTELRPAINLISGSRKVLAAYAELDLPLYEDLIVNAAIRGDDYDDFGSAFSPKVSFHYTLADDWLLRGSWSRGFRAPSLPEISQSNTISYGSAIDPNDPTEPGARRGFTQIRSGNPDLEAERSTNLNAGLVWSPTPGFNAAIDFFHIEQDNIIAPDNTQFIVNNPDIYADRIQRDSAGRLQIITNRYANQGTRTTSGYDIDLSYRTSVGPADVQLSTTWSNLLKYEQALVEGLDPINGAGTNQFGALPDWKSHSALHVGIDNWTWTLSADYTSSYEQRIATESSNPGLDDKVDSFLRFNTQIAYQGLRNTVISLSVINLADSQPPFDPAAGANYFDTNQYNARGRVVDLGIRYTF